MVSLYVSYSWDSEKESQVVEKLEQACQKRGIELRQDKRQIAYGESIRTFMQELGAGRHVVLVLSEAYFKSEYCMYELKEIYDNRDFRQRVYPIVLRGTPFHKPIDRIPYLKHWEDETSKLEQNVASLQDQKFTKNIRAALDNYAVFRQMMDELLAVLVDMNALTEDVHVGTDFAALLDRILPQKAMREPSMVIRQVDSPGQPLGQTQPSTKSTSNKGNAMALNRNDATRISRLEEQISAWEEKLHEFELELVRAEGADARYSIKQKIKRDINPELRSLNQKYADLLRESAADYPITEKEAKGIVDEVIEAIERCQKNTTLNTNIQQELQKIRSAMNSQTTASAKLKVSLPIIPVLANYEIELDTGKFISGIWTKIRGLLARKATTANPR